MIMIYIFLSHSKVVTSEAVKEPVGWMTVVIGQN